MPASEIRGVIATPLLAVLEADRPTPLFDDRLAEAAQAFERAAAERWGYASFAAAEPVSMLASPSLPPPSPPPPSPPPPSPPPLSQQLPALTLATAALASPSPPTNVVTERMHVVLHEPPPPSTRRRTMRVASRSAPSPSFVSATASAPPAPHPSIGEPNTEPEPWSTSPRRLARRRRSQRLFAVVMGLACALAVLSTLRAMRTRGSPDEPTTAAALATPPLTFLRPLDPPLPTVLSAEVIAASPMVFDAVPTAAASVRPSKKTEPLGRCSDQAARGVAVAKRSPR